MKKIILFTLIALLISSCLPKDTQVPQTPLLPLLERKSGMIAYIGADGNMYVSDQAGRNLSQLSDKRRIRQYVHVSTDSTSRNLSILLRPNEV